MEGDEIDDVIDSAVKRARDKGYDHVTFNHPSASSHKDSDEEFPVIIPTYPEELDEHDSYDGKTLKRNKVEKSIRSAANANRLRAYAYVLRRR